MAFARITLDYAVELITARIENGQGSPSDQEIADYCGLQQASDSRSLLADLADAGKITIKGTGADRVITLGRKAAEFVPAPRPTPSIVSRNASEESAPGSVGMASRIDEIREIAARFSTAAAHVKPVSLPRVPPFAGPTKGRGVEHRGNAPAASQSDSPPAIPPGDGGEGARREVVLPTPIAAPQPDSPPLPAPKQGDGEGVQARGSRRDDPAPQPIRAPLPAPKLEMVRLPTKGGGKRNHMLSISITTEMRDALAARSARSGQSRSWEAFSLLGEALTGASAAPASKLRVSAHVTAAAVREGIPVAEFVRDMLERGFDAWRDEWSLERCA